MNHTPKYSDTLKQLSCNLNIQFTGIIEDKNVLFDHIKNSRLFVFPSFNEGMSNMLLEVASLKTHIICSDIIENKAVFNEDEVLFFKTGCVDDLALKITWALQNQKKMNKNYPILWLTGQPGAGKTTLSNEIVKILHSEKKIPQSQIIQIDGDDLRDLTENKDYSRIGRENNIRLSQNIAFFCFDSDSGLIFNF